MPEKSFANRAGSAVDWLLGQGPITITEHPIEVQNSKILEVYGNEVAPDEIKNWEDEYENEEIEDEEE